VSIMALARTLALTRRLGTNVEWIAISPMYVTSESGGCSGRHTEGAGVPIIVLCVRFDSCGHLQMPLFFSFFFGRERETCVIPVVVCGEIKSHWPL
jgi:hypothetical protein